MKTHIFVRPARLWQISGVLSAIVACAASLAACSDSEVISQKLSAGQANRSAVFTSEDSDRLWLFPESAEKLGSGGELHIFMDPERHPHASVSFAKFSLGPGGDLPVHRHDKTEEVGYFIEGEGMVILFPDGQKEEIPVRPGQVVYIAPGEWHALRNTGEDAFALVFATVPNEEMGLLSFFRRIGSHPGEASKSISDEEFSRLAREHDMILKGSDSEE